MSVFKGVLSNGFTVGRRGALIGRKGSRKATTKIRHTLFGSIYSSPWEALSVMSHTGSCAWCIYGVGLGGGVLFSFMEAIPSTPNCLTVTPRGIKSTTRAGQQACMGVLIAISSRVHCALWAQRLNQKNTSSASQLFTLQAKQFTPLGRGHHGPLYVLWSPLQGRVYECVLRGAVHTVHYWGKKQALIGVKIKM